MMPTSDHQYVSAEHAYRTGRDRADRSLRTPSEPRERGTRRFAGRGQVLVSIAGALSLVGVGSFLALDALGA